MRSGHHAFRLPLRLGVLPCVLVCALFLSGFSSERTRTEVIDGFSEPYRSVLVASAESGIVMTVNVRPGAVVRQGQVLATLDDELHRSLLAIADAHMRSGGAVDAARAERHLRRTRLEKLRELRAEGHARQEEVDRSLADLEIANAQLRSAEEEAAIRKLEHEKMKVQLERRTIRAPMDGVVIMVHKEPGEFVAANDPHVLQLVQLHPMKAVFSVKSYQAVRFRRGQSVTVHFQDGQTQVPGIVDVIWPVTDAESGTIKIEVRIDNAHGRLRSGERCQLVVPVSQPPPSELIE